jgi:hypothetical protein
MCIASLVVILVRCTIVMVAAGKGLFKAIAPDEAAEPQRGEKQSDQAKKVP